MNDELMKLPEPKEFLPKKLAIGIDNFIGRVYKYILLTVWAIAALYFYWVVIDNHNPITAVSYSGFAPVKIDNSPIPNAITMKKHICVSHDITLTIAPRFTDDVSFAPSPLTLFYAKGCHDNHITFHVPPELVNDNYSYSSVYTIPVNPFKNMKKTYNVLSLKIIDYKKGIYEVGPFNSPTQSNSFIVSRTP